MKRRKYERYPRITGLRALALLRRLEALGQSTTFNSLLSDVKEALASHVRAEIVRRR